jgi:hypothetical protein
MALAWFTLASVAGWSGQWYAPGTLALCATFAGWLAYRNGHLFRLNRNGRRYAALVGMVASAWAAWNTWHVVMPSGRAAVWLLILTGWTAAPYWYTRNNARRVPVRLVGLDKHERAERLIEAKRLVRDWSAFTSAGGITGAKLIAITYTAFSVIVRVKFRRGQHRFNFTALRMRQLESAFGNVDEGSGRVGKVKGNINLAELRFMLIDPHAEAFSMNPDDTDELVYALFETGDPVIFDEKNTLVAGTIGAGKSGLLAALLRKLARRKTTAVILVDCKPGGVELKRWEPVACIPVVTTIPQVKELFDKIKEMCFNRGTVMAERGWRDWVPTEDEPRIAVIVDEVQEISRAGLGKMLADLVALVRAFGIYFVLATQYPKSENLDTMITKNLRQKIGMYVEDATADRVIFGDQANRTGWTPSGIDASREGSFLVRSPRYREPLLARCPLVSNEEIDEDVYTLEVIKTPVDPGTWSAVGDAEKATAVIDAMVLEIEQGNESDVVDAEIVTTAEVQVLDLITAGVGRPAEICRRTGLSRQHVTRLLRDLYDDGEIHQPGGARTPWVRS